MSKWVRYPTAIAVIGCVAAACFSRFPLKDGKRAADVFATGELIEEYERSPSSEIKLAIETANRDALIDAPLDDAPLIYAALVKGQTDPSTDLTPLYQEALLRDGRNTTAVRGLLYEAQRRGDAAAMVRYINLFLRIKPRETEKDLPILSAIYESPKGRDAVLTALDKAPLWGEAFLLKKIEITNAENLPDLKTAIDRYLQSGPQPKAKNKILTAYTQRLADTGQAVFSKSVWEQYWPDAENPSDDRLNVNADLADIDAGPPFNWTLVGNKRGAAHFEPSGGIFATFNARKDVTLAEQSFIWPPNTGLHVEIEGEHSYDQDEGFFQLDVICQELGRDFTINSFIFDNQSQTSTSHDLYLLEGTFPACEVGRLELVATPGIRPGTVSLSLSSVSVRAIDR